MGWMLVAIGLWSALPVPSLAAERELKAGRNSSAIDYYERSLTAKGSRWFPSASRRD